MNYSIYKYFFLLFIISGYLLSFRQSVYDKFIYLLSSSKNDNQLNDYNYLTSNQFEVKAKAILGTRFNDLYEFKKVVSIVYDKDYCKMDSSECLNSAVNLTYICNGETIFHRLRSGVSQRDLVKINNSGYYSQIDFVINNSNMVRQRKELEKIYLLSRRRYDYFGSNDVAFYDLAEASFHHINSTNFSFSSIRDNSEKGYINTFNHITAHTFITAFFSEDVSDLVGDLHERYNMPELSSGRFTYDQLKDSINYPLDNYVDIINNEIGQRLGHDLKCKYKLNENSLINPKLLSAFLNDIQGYYIWSFGIGMYNFKPSDDLVIKFSNKINLLLHSGKYKL